MYISPAIQRTIHYLIRACEGRGEKLGQGPTPKPCAFSFSCIIDVLFKTRSNLFLPVVTRGTYGLRWGCGDGPLLPLSPSLVLGNGREAPLIFESGYRVVPSDTVARAQIFIYVQKGVGRHNDGIGTNSQARTEVIAIFLRRKIAKQKQCTLKHMNTTTYGSNSIFSFIRHYLEVSNLNCPSSWQQCAVRHSLASQAVGRSTERPSFAAENPFAFI